MATSQFDLHQPSSSTADLFPDTRKASKVRLILGILLLLFLVLSIVFIVLYANEKSDNDDSSNVGTKGSQGGGEMTTSSPKTTGGSASTLSPCLEQSCVISAGDILEKLDETVKPCDDFYQYSCGGFVEDTYIEDDEDSVNSFSLVGNDVQVNLRTLLEDEDLRQNYSKDPNSAVHKAFNYYQSCMNTSHIEKAGNTPMLKLLETFGSAPLLEKNWTAANWTLERILGRVIGNLGIGVFVALDVGTSLYNTSRHVITVGSGASGAGETLSKVDAAQQYRITEGYMKYMTTVFKLIGTEDATKYASPVFQLEVKFLPLKGNLVEKAAVVGYENVTQEMTLDELNKFTDYKFNWTTYINEAFSVAGKAVEGDQKLLVGLPNDIKNIVELISNYSKSDLANEIAWNIIKNSIIAMPEAYREAESELTSIITGIETSTPRWRTCGAATNNVFQYATALLYAERHLSEEGKQRADDLFTEIRSQFMLGLEEQDWMDDATRNQARIKLSTMKQSVGYPAFVKDKVKLDKVYELINYMDPYDLFQNGLKTKKAQVLEKINGLDSPPDDSKYPSPPVGVNAFYHPQTNKITVLVGMLKEPFYGSERLKALNYGAIGMIVGHEISHGFDVSGSQFDEKGNLRSWWSDEALDKFKQRSQCMAAQYSNTYVYGRKLDGVKTLGENIADSGGLKYAYRAYKKWRQTNGIEDKLPGLDFDNDQLFFIGFAQTWCGKYREEKVNRLLQTDTHALNPARVRVPVYNFPEFSKAFKCEPPKSICTVW